MRLKEKQLNWKWIIAGVILKSVVFLFMINQSWAQEIKPVVPAIGPSSVPDIVEQVLPAVVNISTTQKVKPRAPMMDFNMPDMGPGSPFEQFREFFDKMRPPEGGGMPDAKATSLGSGFIIDAAGYIVTNNHVIADADQVSVTLHDGHDLAAKIIGRDPKTDLALLKVDSPKALPFVNLGDSDRVRVGEWVIAVGNPFGLGGTVTAGIISAKARDINAGPFDNFLQTDAAINQGNSGGPMFNMKGEVIGINTAIFSPSGGNIGIGFATPSAMAKPVIDQIKKEGKVRYAWLGVKIQTVTDEIAQSLGLPKTYGALVAEVTPDSPAAKSKIQPGDVIIEYNGQEIDQMRGVPRMVAQTPIGSEVKIVVWRNGSKKLMKTKLTESVEHPSEAEADDQSSRQVPLPGKTQAYLGMDLLPLDKTLREARSIDATVNGLLVSRVNRKSAAYSRGIRPDDVLVMVNEAAISSIDQLKAEVAEASKQSRKFVLIRVWRAGDMHFITLPTDASDKAE